MKLIKCRLKSLVASIFMGKAAHFLYENLANTLRSGTLPGLIALLISVGIRA